MKRIVFVLVAAIGLMVPAVAPSAVEAEVLRVGISSDNPPWSFVPERLPLLLSATTQLPAVTPAQFKTLTGLDADVASALAQQMGAGLRLVPANWQTLEKDLLAKQFDLLLSSWTPSRKTPPGVAVSEPYYTWGLVLCVRADEGNVKSFQSLATAKVLGYYKDPAVEQTLQSLGGVETKTYDNEGTMFRDLKAGKIDVLVHDSTYVRWRVNQDASLKIVGDPLNKLGYHVGVRKDEPELFARVQAAVRALVASPEMARIKAKWEAFGK